MRAMILAAGFGKRMLPITEKTPKALLPVKGAPLIVHHIQRLTVAGIGPIVINLGHLGNQIQQYLGDGRSFGNEILYSEEDPPLETAGGIVKALPLLGSDPFLVVSTDIYTDLTFEQLLKQPAALAHLILVPNPSWHERGDFGFEDNHDQRLSNQAEKKYTFGNLGIYRPELFHNIPVGYSRLGPWLQTAVDQKKVTGELFQGLWYNIGTVAELKRASACGSSLIER